MIHYEWMDQTPLLNKILFAASVAISLTAVDTYAAISISSASGVSAVDSGVTPIFYGGTAGSGTAGTCTAVTATTCNNCAQAAAAAILPCNRNRITVSTIARVYFASSEKDGRATITKEDGTTTIYQNPTSVTKGTTTNIQVTWQPDICSRMATTAIQSDCEGGTPGVNDSLPVRIGIDGDGDQRLSSAADEYINASFKVQRTMAGEVDISAGTVAGTNGIYHFTIYPGDAKVYAEDLTAWFGFPNSANSVAYTKAHLLYKPVATDACDVGLFGNIDVNPDSGSITSQDINADDGKLADPRFFGFQNDVTYYMFKIGLEDRAGNIGLFTADGDCVAVADTTGTDHVVKPGEVLGLLKEQQNCFISTAAFGSRMAPQVQVFRNFRDTFLVKNWLGRKLTLMYYDYSPKFAKVVAQNDGLRFASRIVLYPFLAFAQLALKIGFLGATLVFSIFLLAVFQLWVRIGTRTRA